MGMTEPGKDGEEQLTLFEQLAQGGQAKQYWKKFRLEEVWAWTFYQLNILYVEIRLIQKTQRNYSMGNNIDTFYAV
jgi:hypothetical protein